MNKSVFDDHANECTVIIPATKRLASQGGGGGGGGKRRVGGSGALPYVAYTGRAAGQGMFFLPLCPEQDGI